MKVAILDDWFNTLPALPSFHKLDKHEVTVWNDHETNVVALAERLAGVEALVLIRERTNITGELLDRLPNLRLISQRSVYPHIDVEACTRNGVVLCSDMHEGAPSYAAAELCWALILAAARRLPEQMASLKQGNWIAGMGRTLRGNTIGIYGWGRIGRAVAQYARAFGMNVLIWASELSRQRARDEGWQVAADRETFFTSCDIVTVHVRLYPSTRGTITESDLSLMKADSIFVNTSRAGLLELGALLSSVQAGRPGFAAIDVFDQEPMTDTSDPLLNHPNVIATPHIGYVTLEEFDLQFSDVFDQINAFAAGKPINVVNPQALPAPGTARHGEIDQ